MGGELLRKIACWFVGHRWAGEPPFRIKELGDIVYRWGITRTCSRCGLKEVVTVNIPGGTS